MIMKSTTKTRIEKYCKIAFNSLNSNLNDWKSNPNDKDIIRGVTRVYYDLVHSLSIPSGLITVKALQKKSKDPKWNICHDHCFSPQFIGRMMMDKSDIYLNDYLKFKEMFYNACTTVEILSEENRQLSFLTSNQNGIFKVLVPTNLKYQHLGIELVKRNTGRKWYNKPTDLVSNVIVTPQELLDYEKEFLVS